MSKSHRSSGLIATGVQFAKKMGATGLNLFNHVAPDSVSKLTQTPEQKQVIEGQAQEKTAFKHHGAEKKHYERPQQMLREHIPQVSSQLFGRHYQKINHMASFIAPDFNDRVSDYLFEHLNDAVSQLSSYHGLLKEVGAKDLDELAKNPERSARISSALTNQNKFWAATQGGVTGVAGVLGAALDVPCSIALALRGIYQTGRAYGFELNAEDQNVVEYIFKRIDLSSVAEKQALLAVIRSVSQMLKNQDMQQLQQLLGSSNNPEYLLKWLLDEHGEMKWGWLKHMPQTSFLAKLAPLASASVGASYSMKLVEDATSHAEHVFSNARQYILQHPTSELDPLSAYEQSQAFIAQASPLLVLPAQLELDGSEPVSALSEPLEHDPVTSVELSQKPSQHSSSVENAPAEQVLEPELHQDLVDLAEEYVQPARATTQTSVELQDAKTDVSVNQSSDSVVETSANEKKSSQNSTLDQENNSMTAAKKQQDSAAVMQESSKISDSESVASIAKKPSKSPRSRAKTGQNAAQKNTQSAPRNNKK